jgi:hypothetical protein
MREKDWSRSFDDPIDLPRGRTLVTLEDAGNYITKLPKAEHAAPEWQDAMEALILVATRGGPTMLARIGVMKALNRHVVREFNSDRKDCNHVDVAPSEALSRRSRPGRLSRPLAPDPFHPVRGRVVPFDFQSGPFWNEQRSGFVVF